MMPVAALQFEATGIIVQDRAQYAGMVNDFGTLGREALNYFPTDARSVSHYLNVQTLDPAGFAGGQWAGRYTALRDIQQFETLLAATPTSARISAAQKEAALGWAQTYAALQYYDLAMQYWDQGIVITISQDPKQIQPFVSRDSALKYTVALLDSGKTHLTAAGSATFTFNPGTGYSVNAGGTPFNTAAGFLTFNRALAARVNVMRARVDRFLNSGPDKSTGAGCGTDGVTCYALALQNLSESFLGTGAADPTRFNVGVYDVFSTAAGDIVNGLSSTAAPNRFVNPAVDAPFVQLQPSGAKDKRFLAKTTVLSAARLPSGGAAVGVATNIAPNLYPSLNSPAPIIRNEELVLLRAEAEWFTGAKAAAIADLNAVRVNSGGLAPTTVTTGSSDAQFISALLYERRYSLFWEAQYWPDVRSFNLLSTLPRGLATQFIQYQQPIPQAECLVRIGSSSPCPAVKPGF